ncbi:MAG TPA: hypothetical protein VKK06_13815 [Terriglobia bacterium]|nr:hypothetical protein [Terriglobia bacterium]
MKRSTLHQHIDFDEIRQDFNMDETRRQIAEWADQKIEANSRWESRFKASRSLTTDGCMIYFFFSSISLALLLLLQLSADGQ